MEAKNEVIIKTVGLKKDYYRGETVINALRGIDIEIHKGEFVVIQGESGCGKTTLLNMIGIIDNPTEGSVFINSEDISRMKRRQKAKMILQNGFVFQDNNLLLFLTAIENVSIALAPLGIPEKERNEKARKMLERVGLGDRINHRPTALSGGQKQRVTIARAMVKNPIIVLADEPTGNLDKDNREKILSLLEEFNKKDGQTVLMVTHSEKFSKEGKRVITMEDGKIVKDEKF